MTKPPEPRELAEALLKVGADRAKLIADFADAWYVEVGPQLLRTAIRGKNPMLQYVVMTHGGWSDVRFRVHTDHQDALGVWLPAATKEVRGEIDRLFTLAAAALMKRAVDDVVASLDKR